jgi:hypothetical protein
MSLTKPARGLNMILNNKSITSAYSAKTLNGTTYTLARFCVDEVQPGGTTDLVCDADRYQGRHRGLSALYYQADLIHTQQIMSL